MAVIELRTQLPPEHWGNQFERMRGKRSAASIAAFLNELRLVDFKFDSSDFTRLDDRAKPPRQSPKQVTLSYLTCIICGFDPRVMGLRYEMLPARVQEVGYEEVCRALHPQFAGGTSDLGESSSACIDVIAA